MAGTMTATTMTKISAFCILLVIACDDPRDAPALQELEVQEVAPDESLSANLDRVVTVRTRNNCVPQLTEVYPGEAPYLVVAMPPWCEPTKLAGMQAAWGANVCDLSVPLPGKSLDGGSCLSLQGGDLYGLGDGTGTAELAAVLKGGEAINGVRCGVGAAPWPNLDIFPESIPDGEALRWTGQWWEPAKPTATPCPVWHAIE